LDKVVDVKIPDPASMPLTALARIYWIGVDDFRTVGAGEGLVGRTFAPRKRDLAGADGLEGVGTTLVAAGVGVVVDLDLCDTHYWDRGTEK